jgi:hypothetical protein
MNKYGFRWVGTPTDRKKVFIRAGEDVGAPYQSIGSVIVRNNQKVKFRAGGWIDLWPGFNPEPNALVVLEIGPCGTESDPDFNYNINFDFANQCAVLDCSQDYFAPVTGNCFGTNAAVYTNGGGWYHVMIKNNIGQIIFEDMGPINSLITQYWNGSGSSFFTSLQGVATVDIAIMNCNNIEVRTFTVTYEYSSNCTPSFKILEDSVSNSSYISDELQHDLMLFPNPSSDIIYIDSKMRSSETNEWQYIILGIDGKNIATGIAHDRIDFSTIASGTYFVTISGKDLSETFKIIKQ